MPRLPEEVGDLGRIVMPRMRLCRRTPDLPSDSQTASRHQTRGSRYGNFSRAGLTG